MIQNILKNFDCQTHSNRELILMLEADDEQFELIQTELSERTNISIYRQTKEEFLGTAINRGINYLKGDSIAKFDDDDLVWS